MSNIPDGFAIDGNVYGYGSFKKQTFSLSVGDLARLVASWFTENDESQKVFGVNRKCK